MNTTNYPPLMLLAKSDQPNREFISRKMQFKQLGCHNMDKITVEQYIEYFLSTDFYNYNPKNPYNDISVILKMNEKTFYEDFLIGESKANTNFKLDMATEWKDIYLAPVIIEEWSKAKQVYKPDSDFANALLNTSKLEISKSMINHLPCRCFYIDTMDCEQFDNIVGIFVFIYCLDNTISIVEYTLADDLTYFSFYTGGKFNDQDIIQFDYSDLEDKEYVVYNPAFLTNNYDNIGTVDVKSIDLSRKSLAIFALQMIAYLSIENPDIDTSELTKNTYKPRTASAKVRNKWSEVNINDVGVRYGKAFRKQIDVITKNYNNNNSDNKRKSPVPHFRCAHWHKYWTGKGRTELRLKWIEPVFVGNKEPQNVIIHTVK